LAWITYELGRFGDADKQLTHALELMPDGPTKYLQQKWRSGAHYDYLEDFVSWFQLNAEKLDAVHANFPSFAIIGHMWLSMGDGAEGRRWIEKAEALAPTEYFTYFSLAALASFERQDEQVRHYYQLAHIKARSNKLATLFNGYAELWLENYSAAGDFVLEVFPEFERTNAITVDHNNYRALVTYAKVLQETHREELAVELLGKLNHYFQSSPIDHRALVDISDVETLAMLGRPIEAIALLKKAIEQGWMPNFFKVMTDLEHNPMLSKLAGQAEFQLLLVDVQKRQQVLRAMARR
jgi:tetratricopeptide (TPR) repeat protein